MLDFFSFGSYLQITFQENCCVSHFALNRRSVSLLLSTYARSYGKIEGNIFGIF